MLRHSLAAALIAATVSLAPTPTTAQSPLEICQADLEHYCVDVVPGDGRTLSCLYAHGATLSDPCFEAIDDVARLLEGFFDDLAALYWACNQDLRAFCAEVELGEGSKLQCLARNATDITPACAELIKKRQYYLIGN